MFAPGAPYQYQHPYPYPPQRPVRRPDRGLRVGLVLLLVLALCCGVGDGALAALRAHASGTAPQAYFFGDPAARKRGVAAVLDRRAKAVTGHDQAAFLADVDQSDPSFVRHERDEYLNLVQLGLSSLSYTVESLTAYGVPADQAVLVRRNAGAAWAISVTVRYAVRGLDGAPVAEPWVPIFGYRDGRWVLAGESDADTLPTGAGGLPWEAKPVAVKRSAHVVAVVSADQQDIAPHLLRLAERGLTAVFKVRPSGWAGKVLVTAVSDRNVFLSYFRDSPDKVREVAAIAVPTYDAVPEWASTSHYVTTRVVFNPETLGDGDEELVHDLAHEFTHAAMGPLTSSETPLWLVEGIAEHVGYSTTQQIDDAAVGGVVRRIGIPAALPDDSDFYDSADHYVLAWLACRLIVQRYGIARLIKLYAYFHGSRAGVDSGLRGVLGISLSQFVAAWRAYLKKLAG